MTFPTTSIIDNFNRADSSGLGANWTSGVYDAANSPFGISSNQCAVDPTFEWSEDYYSASTFGADQEIWFTVATLPSNLTKEIYLMLQIQTTGIGISSQVDFYELDFYNNGTVAIFRCDDGAFTMLGSTVTGVTLSTGDSLGFQKVGSTLKGFRKPAAGSWTEIISRTDSTYNTTSYIGMGVQESNTARLDNLGGGDYVAPGSFPIFGSENSLVFGNTIVR